MVNVLLHRCCEARIDLRRKLGCGAVMRPLLKYSISNSVPSFYIRRYLSMYGRFFVLAINKPVRQIFKTVPTKCCGATDPPRICPHNIARGGEKRATTRPCAPRPAEAAPQTHGRQAIPLPPPCRPRVGCPSGAYPLWRRHCPGDVHLCARNGCACPAGSRRRRQPDWQRWTRQPMMPCPTSSRNQDCKYGARKRTWRPRAGIIRRVWYISAAHPATASAAGATPAPSPHSCVPRLSPQ